jgi:ubiquinone/menaquinone biosynthesis C-methylase UbiE
MKEEDSKQVLNVNRWNSRAKNYDKPIYNFFRFMQKYVISLLDLEGNIKMLDIGCGTGWAVRYASQLCTGNGEFYGLDISPLMIEKAKKDSSGYKNVFFFNADSETMPFENNLFDFIICTNSFHHYQNPIKVLEEIYRVLKPNGKIFIMDPNADNTIIRILDNIVSRREDAHVKFYNTREYKSFFEKTNIKYIDSKTMFLEKIQIGQKSVNWTI